MVIESGTQALVTLPQPLMDEVNRIAKEQNWSIGQTILFLAQTGVESQRRAEAALKASYQTFMDESDPEKKSLAGDAMISAIFGPNSVASS